MEEEEIALLDITLKWLPQELQHYEEILKKELETYTDIKFLINKHCTRLFRSYDKCHKLKAAKNDVGIKLLAIDNKIRYISKEMEKLNALKRLKMLSKQYGIE